MASTPNCRDAVGQGNPTLISLTNTDAEVLGSTRIKEPSRVWDYVCAATEVTSSGLTRVVQHRKSRNPSREQQKGKAYGRISK